MTRRTIAWLLALIACIPSHAAAQGDWHIALFDVRTDIQEDGGVRVTETITAVFQNPKRGIYRTIPVHYTVAYHQYSLRFRLLGVTDERGAARQTKVTREGPSVQIRIGNPHVRVTGAHVYRIEYVVDRAILHEQDRTVLRWNATGNEWGVPIERSTVTVGLPAPLDDTQLVYDAWTGVYGATDKNFARRRVDDRTVEFQTGRLEAREGITIEVSMPETALAQPSALRRLAWIITDNLAYGVFLAVLVGCFGYWRRRGRDPPGMGSIVVQYEPPDDLGPAEIGTLADEKVHMQDISAAIVDLAVRGYLEIEEVTEKKLLVFTDTDYRFTRKKEPDDLAKHERLIFEGIFDGGRSAMLSDLKYEFHATVASAKREIYRSLAKRRYFDGNPETIRQVFPVVGIVMAAVLLGGVAFLQRAVTGAVQVFPIVAAGVLSAITIVVFSRIVPRKTRKGRLAWERIKGLEEYMQRAEQRELEAAERLGIFERLLPHAIALGLTERWATAFEGIYTTPPSWYHGHYHGSFTTHAFVHSLNESVSSMNSTLPAQQRSSGGSSGGFSGGGFSGGGFGGGGGGAW